MKQEVLATIKQSGLVAVIRAESEPAAENMVAACIEGGVKAVEITFTVPKAHHLIEKLVARYASHLMIGAGTVLDPETCRTAILSGAQFIVSPYFNKQTVELCHRYQIAVMPGAMTLREVALCMEAGADIIKIFPGELFGPQVIKAFKGPIPTANLMPTGGVTVENVGEWIKAGATAVGVGGSLTASAKTGDFQTITRLAGQFIQNIKLAREKGV